MSPTSKQPEVEPCEGGISIRIGADVYDLDIHQTQRLLDDIENAKSVECGYCHGGVVRDEDCIVCDGKGWHS